MEYVMEDVLRSSVKLYRELLPKAPTCRDVSTPCWPEDHNDAEAAKVVNEGGDVTATTTIEAFWFNNAYVPTDDKLGGMTWTVDLLPGCPLYEAIRYVWAYAMAEFTSDQYVDRADPDLVRLRPFKTNLHWLLTYIPYTRSEWNIVTPSNYPAGLPAIQIDK
jgi:hypothetical protein